MSAAPFHLPAQTTSGVYHLVDGDGSVLYVGQTNNIYVRLAGHPLRRFASEVHFFPAPIADLNALEAAHIRDYAAKYNRAGLTTQFIPIIERRRGIRFNGERYASAAEVLAGRKQVGIGVLRALGLLSKSSEVPELLATGFPEPFFSRGRHRLAWYSSDVLRFLSAREAA